MVRYIDHFHNNSFISAAVKEMADCSKVIAMGNVTTEDTQNLAQSLQNVLECIHAVQAILPDTLDPPLSNENSTTSVHQKRPQQTTSTPFTDTVKGREDHTTVSLPLSLSSEPLFPNRTLPGQWTSSPSFNETSSFAPTDPSIQISTTTPAKEWANKPNKLQKPIIYPTEAPGDGQAWSPGPTFDLPGKVVHISG